MCKTTYEKKCKPAYNYGQTCEDIPKQSCSYEKKCTTSYVDTCKDVPKQECKTVYDKKCENVPKQECKTTYDQRCEKYPKELCTTSYKESCKDIPHQNCKNVKNCVKIPEQKCWKTSEVKCTKVPEKVCHKVPKKNCWKVAIKKNRYVKKKQCQKCQRDKETFYVKSNRQNCKNVPRKECRTLYYNDCKKVPYNDCKTVYTEKCGYKKKCRTEYELRCTKPKPAYNAPPSYGAVKEQCENIPSEKCWNEKQCTQEPSQKCSVKYNESCNKVPREKCSTVNELKCEKYTVDVPNTKIRTSCYWPAKHHQDRFCSRSSDYDIVLDAGSDYSPDVEYLGAELQDRIDFLGVFPVNYKGSPNETLGKDGRRVYPLPAAPLLNLVLAPESPEQRDVPNIQYIGNIENNQNRQNIETTENIQNSLNNENIQNTQNIDDDDIGNVSYLFPTAKNTSGVLQQVSPPLVYQGQFLPTPSSFFPEYSQTSVDSANPYQRPKDGVHQDVSKVPYSGGFGERFNENVPSPAEFRQPPRQGLSALDATAFSEDRNSLGPTPTGFFPENMSTLFGSQISQGFQDSPVPRLETLSQGRRHPEPRPGGSRHTGQQSPVLSDRKDDFSPTTEGFFPDREGFFSDTEGFFPDTDNFFKWGEKLK